MQCASTTLSFVQFPAIDIFSHYLIKGTFLENPVIEFKMRFIPTNCLKHFSSSEEMREI
jgi:hypothetical protein